MNRLRFLLAILMLLAIPIGARGQWVSKGGFGAAVTTVYFMSDLGYPETGFVGLENGVIWKTGDGGSTWMQVTIPNASGPITSFTFKSTTTGWLSLRPTYGRPAIFQTSDAGVTWSPIAIGSERPCIYYLPSTRLLFSTSLTSSAIVSGDDGFTWGSLGVADMNGIDFSDNTFGVMSCYSGREYVTQNGGVSWDASALGAECWKPLALKGRHILYALSESERELYRTRDNGATWEQMARFQSKPTGDVEGTCNTLYMQSDSGVYRSADEGITWEFLRGPGNAPDTRFTVVGNFVYAGSLSGGLWRYTNDDPPYTGHLGFSGAVPSIVAIGCESVDTTITIRGRSACKETILLGMDAAIPINASAVLKKPVPLKLPDDSIETVLLHYSPVGATPDSLLLTFHFSVGDAPFDTTLLVLARTDPKLELSADKQSLALHSTASCAHARASIIFQDGKCDSLRLDSVTFDDSVRFRAVGLLMPYSVGPRGFVQVTVDAHGENKGTYVATMTLHLAIRGKPFVYKVPVTLRVDATGVLQTSIMPARLSIPATSLCGRKDISCYVTNPSCQPYSVVSVKLIAGSSEFQILQTPILPRVLNEDDEDSIVIRYSPVQTGNTSATLDIQLSADSVSRDTMVQISASGYSLSKARLSVDQISFDTIERCDQADTILFVRNESCDSTEIVEVIQPTDQSFVVLDPKPPLWIPPGDSIPMHVLLQPTGTQLRTGSAELRIVNKGKSEQALDLGLTAFVRPARRIVYISVDSIDEEQLFPCSIKDTIITIANRGTCDTIVIRNLNIAGSWFEGDGGAQLPVVLYPGDSLRFVISTHAAPDSGVTGSIEIVGDRLDTLIPCRASVAAYTGNALAVVRKDSSYPTKHCTVRQGQIDYVNRTCGSVTIDSLTLVPDSAPSNQFVLGSTSLPATLQTGDTLRVTIFFDADGTGDGLAQLYLHAQEGEPADTVRLTGESIGGTASARIRLELADGGSSEQVPAGVLTSVILRMEDDIPDSLGLNQIHLQLNFDDNVLTRRTATVPNGWALATADGFGYTSLSLSRQSQFDIRKGDELIKISYYTTIGDALQTVVVASDLTFNGGDSNYRRCTLAPIPIDDSIRIGLNPICGDSLMLRELRKEPLIDGFTVVPNPIAADDGNPVVNFALSADAAVDVELSDIGGNPLDRTYYPILRRGKHVLPVTRRRLSSGAYFIRFRSDGESLIRKLVVR